MTMPTSEHQLPDPDEFSCDIVGRCRMCDTGTHREGILCPICTAGVIHTECIEFRTDRLDQQLEADLRCAVRDRRNLYRTSADFHLLWVETGHCASVKAAPKGAAHAKWAADFSNCLLAPRHAGDHQGTFFHRNDTRPRIFTWTSNDEGVTTPHWEHEAWLYIEVIERYKTRYVTKNAVNAFRPPRITLSSEILDVFGSREELVYMPDGAALGGYRLMTRAEALNAARRMSNGR